MLTPLIPEWAQHRIRLFLDRIVPLLIVRPALSVPQDMIVGSILEGGWARWHPVNSPVVDEDILHLESRIKTQLPPLFRAYFMYKCFLMGDFRSVRLPSVPSNHPLEDLEYSISSIWPDTFYQRNHYLPFGNDSNDVGTICFDLKRATSKGDYPIILVDYSLMRNSKYSGVERWSSFELLIDELEQEI